MLGVGRYTGQGKHRFWEAECDPFPAQALLHFDGSDMSTTFTDEVGTSWSIAAGTVNISTDQSVLGGSSCFFSSGRLASGTTLPSLLGGDFTVEAFVYSTSFGNYQVVCGDSAGGAGWTMRIEAGGGSFTLTLPGVSSNGASFSFSTNTWYHLAIVRQNTTLYFYVDGSFITSNTLGTINGASRTCYIGAQGDGSYPMVGYIDEVRWARKAKTTGSTFPVPAVEYLPPCPDPTTVAPNTPPFATSGDGPWRYFRWTVSQWTESGVPGTSTAGVRVSEMELLEGGTAYPTSNMTSDSAPSPLVASVDSTQYGSAYNAFDGTTDDSHRWISGTGSLPHWLQIDLGSGNEITPEYYRWAPDSAGASYYPTDWKLEASNTGSFTGEQDLIDFRTSNSSTVLNWIASTPRLISTTYNQGTQSHRYWRLTNIQVPGGGFLEISEVALYNGASDVTSGATVTSSDTPAVGSIGDIVDSNTGTRCYWTEATVEAGESFWIKFDFGAAQTVDGVQQAGFDTSTRFMVDFDLQYSDDDSTWTSLGMKIGLPYPGNNTFSSTYAFPF